VVNFEYYGFIETERKQMRIPEQVIEDLAKVQQELKALNGKRETLVAELYAMREFVDAALSGLKSGDVSQ
jgi:type VI protein secretion system component VasF